MEQQAVLKVNQAKSWFHFKKLKPLTFVQNK